MLKMTWALTLAAVVPSAAFTFSVTARSFAKRDVAMLGHDVVLYTGVEDMRVSDNDGLWAAADADSWTPVLVVPPSLKGAKRQVLQAAAIELDAELTERYGAKLVVAKDLEPLRGKADNVHVISEYDGSSDFHAWSCDLRPAYEGSGLFSEYCAWARSVDRIQPREAPSRMPLYVEESSDWELLSANDDETITEPYVDVAVSLCGCRSAPVGVDDYVKMGREAFANEKFRNKEGASSLYAAAAKWIAGDNPGERMAAREPAERAFGAALAVGGLSKRQLAAKAKDTFPPSKLGTVLRSSSGCLLDVAEWREWYDILKNRRSQDSWWPWASAAYPVRYIQYKKASAEKKKALVLIHGFGSSADQWKRLSDELSLGDDVSIYAVDYVGFGYSSKPGFTYTQHLWEQMLEDFVREVVIEDGHETCVLAGNSIGGGLAAGLSANLGPSCSGLILLNTAGNILEADEGLRLDDALLDVKRQTLNVLDRNAKAEEVLAPFSPPPGKQVLLDAFGQLVIELLSPRIPSLLKRYFPVNPDNADEVQAYEIARAAADPGAAVVIASGAKLPPQRSLNEVLASSDSVETGFRGPVLVPQGELDYVSGPDRARSRANQLANLRNGVTVKLLVSGHCPHDETPDLVAREIESWWTQV